MIIKLWINTSKAIGDNMQFDIPEYVWHNIQHLERIETQIIREISERIRKDLNVG